MKNLKKEKGVSLITLVITIIVVIILAAIALTVGCTNNNDTNINEDTNMNTNNSIDTSDDNNQNSLTNNTNSLLNVVVDSDENLDVHTYVSYDKEQLIVCVKNNTSADIGSFDIEAIYYDKNNHIIADDSDISLDFKNNSTYATTLDLPHDDDYNFYIPEKIELSVKIDQEYQEVVDLPEMYNDKITMTYKVVEDEVEVTITNNSTVNLPAVESMLLFVKDRKPIATINLRSFLEAGKSDTIKEEIPIDWEKSEDEHVIIDFDSIEFVVNRAIAD